MILGLNTRHWLVVFVIVLAGVLVAGACNAQERVIMWRAKDGSVFDSQEKAIRYEKAEQIAQFLEIKDPDHDWSQYALRRYAVDIIVDYWPEIKAIMEGKE